MNIEDAYVAADKRLRENLKETKSALNGAKGKDRQLILATGALSVIYANEMHAITLEASLKSIGDSSHPATAIKAKLIAYLDDVIERYDAYLRTQLN